MHLAECFDPFRNVLELLCAHDRVERRLPERLRQVEHTRLPKRHLEAELRRPPPRRLEMVDVDAVHVQPLGKRNERLPDVERLAQPAAAHVENAERAALPQLGTQVEDQADPRGTARHARQVEPCSPHLVEHAGRRGR